MNKTLITTAAVALVASSAGAQRRLETVFSSRLLVNGPTVSHDGRLFFVVQPDGEKPSPQVVEVHGKSAAAYPNEQWNSWKSGEDGHKLFVGVNSIRIGPDGALWVVDRGAPGMGKPLAPGGPKLIRIDGMNGGLSTVHDPITVYRVFIGQSGVRR